MKSSSFVVEMLFECFEVTNGEFSLEI